MVSASFLYFPYYFLLHYLFISFSNSLLLYAVDSLLLPLIQDTVEE